MFAPRLRHAPVGPGRRLIVSSAAVAMILFGLSACSGGPDRSTVEGFLQVVSESAGDGDPETTCSLFIVEGSDPETWQESCQQTASASSLPLPPGEFPDEWWKADGFAIHEGESRATVTTPSGSLPLIKIDGEWYVNLTSMMNQ